MKAKVLRNRIGLQSKPLNLNISDVFVTGNPRKNLLLSSTVYRANLSWKAPILKHSGGIISSYFKKYR